MCRRSLKRTCRMPARRLRTSKARFRLRGSIGVPLRVVKTRSVVVHLSPRASRLCGRPHELTADPLETLPNVDHSVVKIHVLPAKGCLTTRTPSKRIIEVASAPQWLATARSTGAERSRRLAPLAARSPAHRGVRRSMSSPSLGPRLRRSRGWSETTWLRRKRPVRGWGGQRSDFRSHHGRASKIGAQIGLLRAGQVPARFAASVRASISRPMAAPAQSRYTHLVSASSVECPPWSVLTRLRYSARHTHGQNIACTHGRDAYLP